MGSKRVIEFWLKILIKRKTLPRQGFSLIVNV